MSDLSDFGGFGGVGDDDVSDEGHSAFSMAATSGMRRRRKKGAETFNTYAI